MNQLMKSRIARSIFFACGLLAALALAGCGVDDETARKAAEQRLQNLPFTAASIDVDSGSRTVTYNNVSLKNASDNLQIDKLVERGLDEAAYKGDKTEVVSLEALELHGVKAPDLDGRSSYALGTLTLKNVKYPAELLTKLAALQDEGNEAVAKDVYTQLLKSELDDLALADLSVFAKKGAGNALTVASLQMSKPSLEGAASFDMKGLLLRERDEVALKIDSLSFDELRLPSMLTGVARDASFFDGAANQMMILGLMSDPVKAVSPFGFKNLRISGVVKEGEAYPSLDHVNQNLTWSDKNAATYDAQLKDLPVDKNLIAQWNNLDASLANNTLNGAFKSINKITSGVCESTYTLDVKGGGLGSINGTAEFQIPMGGILGTAGGEFLIGNMDVTMDDKGIAKLLLSMVGQMDEATGPELLEAILGNVDEMLASPQTPATTRELLQPLRDTLESGGKLHLVFKPKSPMTSDDLFRALTRGEAGEKIGLSITKG